MSLRKEELQIKKKNRIYQIDLFRFIAALAVVLYHYLFRGYMADNMSNLHFDEIGKYFKYGYLGVDLFFIISGFVITLSIKSRSIKTFLISRISRLYPSYWLSILITSIVIYFFGYPNYTVDLKQFFINLTMFQNYFNIKSIDGVYWSLLVEMKFYIFIIGTYLITNKIREIKLDYLIYLWLFLSIIYLPFDDKTFFKALNFILILNWSSYFIAGMIFYQIFINKINIKYIILLIITMCVSIINGVLRIEDLENHYNTSFDANIITGLIVLFYILMFLVSSGRLKMINSPKLINLGLLTYPLYLLHQNIGFVIFNNLGTESNKYILLFITLIFMIVLSYLISKFYEPKISKYISENLKRL